MADNVIKFRRPEKQPEPPKQRAPRELPAWLWWLAILVLAVVLVAVLQPAAFFG